MSIIEKAVARLEKSGASPSVDVRRGESDRRPLSENPQRAGRNLCRFDFEALRRNGYLVEEGSSSRLAEQYRRIKRPLLRNAFHSKTKNSEFPPNMLVVSSACAGEGKTFNALNLAFALAQEKDLNVLLIDGDVVRAQLSRLLGLEKEKGLTDLLKTDYSAMLGTIVDTNVEGLHVLPAGQVDEYSTELLSSKKMHQFMRELLRVYNDSLIIFDAPPLLRASQANVLCELAGQIVLIVEAGKTTRSEIKETVGMLDQSKPIGLILNKTMNSAGGYYDGYYGYQETVE